MIKYTQGEWELSNPVILCVEDKAYFAIKAGMGFYTVENKDYDGTTSGFEVRGHLQRGDAVLLANAKKMYEALLKITQSDHESDLMEACNIADNLLEEMEAQANEKS